MVAQATSGSAADRTAQRLAELERRIEALSRKKAYPWSIAPNGSDAMSVRPDSTRTLPNGQPVANVTIGDGAGNALISTFPGVGGAQTSVLADQGAAPMMRLDEYAGYGISHPSLLWGLYPTADNLSAFAAAAFAGTKAILTGNNFAYNPAVFISALIIPGAANSYGVHFEATYSGTTVSSSTLTLTGQQIVQQFVLLPKPFMSVAVNLSMMVNNSVSQTIRAAPISCYGVSQLAYDIAPNFH